MRLPEKGQLLRCCALTILSVALGAASGCGVIRDRSSDYLTTPATVPIRIPEWQDGQSVRHLYPVPELKRETLLPSEFELPESPDLTGEILDENYAVEEVDGQSWLLVNDVPGRVWPSVERFLQLQGLTIGAENPRGGLIQTGLVAAGSKAAERMAVPADASSVVLARITPGVRRKSSEIQFRLIPVAGNPEAMRPWTSVAMSPAERRLLDDLSAFLREQEERKSYSRLALEIPAETRVHLVTGENKPPYLRLNLGLERSWVEVNKALISAAVPIVDVDRSAGTWFVDFRPEDERNSQLFGWFRDPPPPEITFVVQLLKEGDELRVVTSRAPEFGGDDRSSALLSAIYEYLY